MPVALIITRRTHTHTHTRPVSRAKILESPTLYLSSGTTLNLTCIVRDTPEPPDYIFWYYNGQVILSVGRRG